MPESARNFQLVPESAKKRSVILLSGNEDVLRRRALDELAPPSGEDSLDVETLVAGEAAPEAWLGAAMTAPFLAPRRTVIVRNLLRAGSPKDSIGESPDRLASLPATSLLVLIADDEQGDESRQWKLADHRKAWESFVDKAKGAVLRFERSPDQVRKGLADEFARQGKRIGPKALALLIEMTGASLSRGCEEAEKLCLFAGENAEIAEEDVRQAVVPSREWNVYKLVDHIAAGETAHALQQLMNLVGTVSKAEDTAFARIFPTLSNQLRLIWQARMFVEARLALPMPAAAARDEASPASAIVRKLPKKSILSEPEWRQRKAMALARRLDFDRITECLKALADADCALKGMPQAFSPIDCLEQMVLRMSAATSS